MSRDNTATAGEGTRAPESDPVGRKTLCADVPALYISTSGDDHEPLMFGNCLRPDRSCSAGSIGRFAGRNSNQSTTCVVLGSEAAGRRTYSGDVLHRGRGNLVIDNPQDVARARSNRKGFGSSLRSESPISS